MKMNLRVLLLAATCACILTSRVQAQLLEDTPFVPTAAVVKGTIAALEDADEEVVLAALREFTEWRSAEAASDVARLLVADTPVRVRHDAFNYFVALGEKSHGTLPALIPYLSDSDAGVRERVLLSIAASGAAADFQENVVPMLADARKEVRVAAAQCLGRAGMAASKHRDALLAALARAGSVEFKVAIMDALASVGGMSVADAEKLLPFATDRSSEVRIAASAAVLSAMHGGKKGFDAMRAEVMKGFQKELPEVRGAILKHMVSDPESAKLALDMLVAELSNAQIEPRIAALYALGMAGNEALPHVEAVVSLYKSENDELRAAVLACLRGMGKNVVETRMEMVMRALLDPSDAVRAEALLALPLCGPTLKNRPFKVFDVLDNHPPQVRETLLKAAAVVIKTLGSEAEPLNRLQKELLSPDSEHRIAACFVAGQLGSKNGAPIFKEVLALTAEKNADVKGAAAIALRSFADKAHIRAALRPLLKDDQDQVRWAALDTLAESEPGADAALVDEIAALLKDPDRAVRNAAVRALGVAGPAAKAHFPAIVEMFTDDPETPPFEAARTVLQLGPLNLTEISMLLKSAFVSKDVAPIVRLTAYGASAGDPKARILLRVTDQTNRPIAKIIEKKEFSAAAAVLKEVIKAPSIHPKLKHQLEEKAAELKALDIR